MEIVNIILLIVSCVIVLLGYIIYQQYQSIQILNEALLEASKNDNRNPITGRFIKAK